MDIETFRLVIGLLNIGMAFLTYKNGSKKTACFNCFAAGMAIPDLSF